MFLIRAAATEPGPDTPCVLTGYGGFAVSLGPAYSAAIVEVCDAGGLYAVANLGAAPSRARRGTGPACASTSRHVLRRLRGRRRLARRSPDDVAGRLAIRGGSNGGLLMGGHHHAAARPVRRRADRGAPRSTWCATTSSSSPGCGSPSTATPSLPTSSPGCTPTRPTTTSRTGTCYPAVLLTTAEDDSRVRPDARPQDDGSAAGGDVVRRPPPRPVAGGGPGRSRPGQAGAPARPTELADVLAFLWWQLGLPIRD